MRGHNEVSDRSKMVIVLKYICDCWDRDADKITKGKVIESLDYSEVAEANVLRRCSTELRHFLEPWEE